MVVLAPDCSFFAPTGSWCLFLLYLASSFNLKTRFQASLTVRVAATPPSDFGFCFYLSLDLTFVSCVVLLFKWCTLQQNLRQAKTWGLLSAASFSLLLGTNLQTPLNASGRASGEFWPIVFFSTPWIILGIQPGPQTPGQHLSVEQA